MSSHAWLAAFSVPIALLNVAVLPMARLLSIRGQASSSTARIASAKTLSGSGERPYAASHGVPTDKVRYDNLKAAVAQVLGFSRHRVETERWTAFRSHYGLEAFYCQPGFQGAHEKGGVEGQIGWFRRNHLVPVPSLNLSLLP